MELTKEVQYWLWMLGNTKKYGHKKIENEDAIGGKN